MSACFINMNLGVVAAMAKQSPLTVCNFSLQKDGNDWEILLSYQHLSIFLSDLKKKSFCFLLYFCILRSLPQTCARCTHAPESAGMECIVLILDRGQELIWGKVLFSFIWSYYKENTIL